MHLPQPAGPQLLYWDACSIAVAPCHGCRSAALLACLPEPRAHFQLLAAVADTNVETLQQQEAARALKQQPVVRRKQRLRLAQQPQEQQQEQGVQGQEQGPGHACQAPPASQPEAAAEAAAAEQAAAAADAAALAARCRLCKVHVELDRVVAAREAGFRAALFRMLHAGELLRGMHAGELLLVGCAAAMYRGRGSVVARCQMCVSSEVVCAQRFPLCTAPRGCVHPVCYSMHARTCARAGHMAKGDLLVGVPQERACWAGLHHLLPEG